MVGSPQFSPGLLRASCPAPLRGQRRCAWLLKIAPGDFVGILGHSGKADWAIARLRLAVAMGEAESGKGPVDLYPAERVAQGRDGHDGHPVNGRPVERVRQGRRTLGFQAKQECVAQEGQPWTIKRSGNAQRGWKGDRPRCKARVGQEPNRTACQSGN